MKYMKWEDQNFSNYSIVVFLVHGSLLRWKFCPFSFITCHKICNNNIIFEVLSDQIVRTLCTSALVTQ